MDDAAVVAALMPAHAVFFFQRQQAEPRESLRDFEPYGQPNDTSADDDDVVA
jgi:hypothetical protein